MLISGQGKAYTGRQRWWREKRLPQVEGRAYALIREHERRYGKLPGCIIQPELLLPTAGCEHYYFRDDEREKLGIPCSAIGALRPHQRMIFVHEGIENVGREGQTFGEEIGHFLLHAEGVPSRDQLSLGFEEPVVVEQHNAFFCRTEDAAYVDGKEEPAWMTREAAFFAACLQMPRDRYLPVAEQRLTEAIRRQPKTSGCFRSVEEKLKRARSAANAGGPRGDLAPRLAISLAEAFDTAVVELVLELLEMDHKGRVSKAAQRRRFVELGLVHDAAGLLEDFPGSFRLSRFEDFFLSDRLVENATGMRGGNTG